MAHADGAYGVCVLGAHDAALRRCPSCILTDNPTSNWLITRKCVHKYGSNPRCRDSCYGCGVHLSGCSGFGNERYCQAALYDSSCGIIETRSESVRRGIPMICKSCLCPSDSHSRCVSLCKCFMSDNKYFVWRSTQQMWKDLNKN